MNYSMISDISFLNSNSKTQQDFKILFESGILNDNSFSKYILLNDIKGIDNIINSPLKKRMSQMSIGVFYVLENGPGKILKDDEEIYLFSSFAEIDTTNKIIKDIVMNNAELVSPTLFHNSVHNTALGYYTIIKKKHNYCATISDGLDTNLSFINYIKNRVLLDESFVVVSGEEYSSFFELDRTCKLNIKSIFGSYRIVPDSKKGFKFLGEFDNSINLLEEKIYMESDYIFADRQSYLNLCKDKNKKIYTEYPIVSDNPCGIFFRLALPFYLELKGQSLIIEKTKNKTYLFGVQL